jgi:hypothetical protein
LLAVVSGWLGACANEVLARQLSPPKRRARSYGARGARAQERITRRLNAYPPIVVWVGCSGTVGLRAPTSRRKRSAREAPVRRLPGDDEEERGVRLLLLGKAAVLAHRYKRPLAAEMDEKHQDRSRVRLASPPRPLVDGSMARRVW